VTRLTASGATEEANRLLAERRSGELAMLTRLFEEARAVCAKATGNWPCVELRGKAFCHQH